MGSAKKRKAGDARGADAPRPPGAETRYHPGEGFEETTDGMPVVDLNGVQGGSKELWLLQLPKPLTCQSLHGVQIDMGESRGDELGIDTLGTLSTEDGTNYRMEVESRQQSRQLYVVSQSSGSRDEFGMWPVAKRLTLEHIEEGPLPLAVEQSDPEAEPFGDAPMLPPSSAAKVQAGAADEGLTSKETPGKDEAKSAKKEKKEKKDKKDRKDKKSRESR